MPSWNASRILLSNMKAMVRAKRHVPAECVVIAPPYVTHLGLGVGLPGVPGSPLPATGPQIALTPFARCSGVLGPCAPSRLTGLNQGRTFAPSTEVAPRVHEHPDAVAPESGVPMRFYCTSTVFLASRSSPHGRCLAVRGLI